MEPGQTTGECIAFGRFRVLPRQRCLLADGEEVPLGARAFDLLLALLNARGTVIGKEALISQVWPSQIVTEDNLRVQMSALRTALGPDRDLIRTVAGRGYQFIDAVDPVAVSPERLERVGEAARALTSSTNLPEPVSELIGRDVELQEIMALTRHRLVTLTGPGGVGKTRLALEAARNLLPEFADGVWLADLSAVNDAGLVPAAIAAAVGLDFGNGAISAEHIASALRAKALLIVLDTCEHLIDATAQLAETLLLLGPKVHIIATSRETLGAQGEWVYRVRPLPVAAEEDATPADDRAVLLFVTRARATNLDLPTEQSATHAIATICRRLDGIPLAIELAAARAATLGIYMLADRLDDHLQLLTCGRRTALPRHQTLRATLDWSFSLLTAAERLVLCRLSVLRGAFTLDEARAAALGDELGTNDVTKALANLVSKSLVSRDAAEYRLLETTRAYALEKLTEGGEPNRTARFHGACHTQAPVGPAGRRPHRAVTSLPAAA